MRISGWGLEYASPSLRADKEVVLTAVKQNGSAIQYAHRDLKSDRDIIIMATNPDR